MKVFKSKSSLSALDRIVRAAVRLSVKLGFNYEDVRKLLWYHFVAEPKKMLDEAGEPKSDSPTVLTKYSGVGRRHIKKILEEGHPIKDMHVYPKFAESDVVIHWKKQYCDEYNKALPLKEMELVQCIKESAPDCSGQEVIKSLLLENVINKVNDVYFLRRDKFLPETEEDGIAFKLEVASRQILGITYATVNNMNCIGNKEQEWFSEVHYEKIHTKAIANTFKRQADRKLRNVGEELQDISTQDDDSIPVDDPNRLMQGYVVSYIELPDDE